MSRRGKTVTSVYVRNLHQDIRPDDLRKVFTKYGDVSDCYVPLDYYTRQPRGFAYVQVATMAGKAGKAGKSICFSTMLAGKAGKKLFDYREDADDAIYYLDGYTMFGRALEVQMAQGDRKTPTQMRRGPPGGGGGSRRRRSFSRSRSRSPRGRRRYSPSRSRSRSPRGGRRPRRSQSRSPPRRSRSISPRRSRSRSPPAGSRSPPPRSRSPAPRSRSPPVRSRSPSRSRSRSR